MAFQLVYSDFFFWQHFLLSDGEEQFSIGTKHIRDSKILKKYNIKFVINLDMLGGCSKNINLYYIKISPENKYIKSAQEKSKLDINYIDTPKSIIKRCDYRLLIDDVVESVYI